MFTLLLIIAIICAIYAYKKNVNPDIDESGLHFKDPKKIEEYKSKLVQLESCSYKCKEMSDSEKAMNLWPKESALLETFSFANGFISIRMKDGKTLSANLLDVSTKFIICQGDNVRCLVTCGENSIEFFTIAYLFKDEEWYSKLFDMERNYI